MALEYRTGRWIVAAGFAGLGTSVGMTLAGAPSWVDWLQRGSGFAVAFGIIFLGLDAEEKSRRSLLRVATWVAIGAIVVMFGAGSMPTDTPEAFRAYFGVSASAHLVFAAAVLLAAFATGGTARIVLALVGAASMGYVLFYSLHEFDVSVAAAIATGDVDTARAYDAQRGIWAITGYVFLALAMVAAGRKPTPAPISAAASPPKVEPRPRPAVEPAPVPAPVTEPAASPPPPALAPTPAPPPAAAAHVASFCPNCGAKAPAGARFCGECGAALPQMPSRS